MPNPATTSDIAARWRTLNTQQEGNAAVLLDDAWDLLLGRRPTLETDMTAGTVRSATVKRVVCAMVLRVLKNPDGKSEVAVDDYRYKRADAIASGELYVTPAELADVSPGRRSRKSVRLVAYGDV